MKTTLRQHFFEISCFLVLSFGLVVVSQSQTTFTIEEQSQEICIVQLRETERSKMSSMEGEERIHAEINPNYFQITHIHSALYFDPISLNRNRNSTKAVRP